MATQRGTIDFLLEQAAGAGHVSARRMFGEYAVYCDGRVVGFVCDDRLFIKPTPAGRAQIGAVTEAPPYPGAKLYLLVDADRWEDADWIATLVRVTAAALPPALPKPAGKRRKATPPA